MHRLSVYYIQSYYIQLYPFIIGVNHTKADRTCNVQRFYRPRLVTKALHHYSSSFSQGFLGEKMEEVYKDSGSACIADFFILVISKSIIPSHRVL